MVSEVRVRIVSIEIARRLTAIAVPSPAAGVLLPGPEAVLAIYGPVASRLKRHCGLLPARGTGDRIALGFGLRVISATAGLFILLFLATRLAAFRSRIGAFLEKCLVFAGKREFLSAVATGHLQFLCHKTFSLYCALLRTAAPVNGQIR